VVGEDIEFDADGPEPPPARSYRLLAVLSVAAIATVLLVPYAGLGSSGDFELVRSDAGVDAEPVDTDSAAETSSPREKAPKPDEFDETDGDQRIVPVVGGEPAVGTTTSTLPTITSSPPPPLPPFDYSRPIPSSPPSTVPSAPPPPWEDSTRTTTAGFIATDVGCADSTSAADLDEFFRARMGPVIGHDYQHVYALGENRFLWLFQDTFIDQPGVADELDEADFVHNSAMMQTGRCFTLYHRGAAASPTSFEPGTGEQALSKWFWPLGGELADGQLYVFWAEMAKDSPEPPPGEGLGWHPVRTWLARYDPGTLERLAFAPAPDPGVSPIYGYAVASDRKYTYLFGNTYDQNLARQGGWENGPHSATRMWLARVPRGRLGDLPEYRTARGWTSDPARAKPILSRFWTENPMQPRFIQGQWVAATKRDGFWGHELLIEACEIREAWCETEHSNKVRGGAMQLNHIRFSETMCGTQGADIFSVFSSIADRNLDGARRLRHNVAHLRRDLGEACAQQLIRHASFRIIEKN